MVWQHEYSIWPVILNIVRSAEQSLMAAATTNGMNEGHQRLFTTDFQPIANGGSASPASSLASSSLETVGEESVSTAMSRLRTVFEFVDACLVVSQTK